MFEYYVVYSLTTDKGSGFGRDTVTTDRPIETMEHIKAVEATTLQSAQKVDPSASSLFLVNWRKISKA